MSLLSFSSQNIQNHCEFRSNSAGTFSASNGMALSSAGWRRVLPSRPIKCHYRQFVVSTPSIPPMEIWLHLFSTLGTVPPPTIRRLPQQDGLARFLFFDRYFPATAFRRSTPFRSEHWPFFRGVRPSHSASNPFPGQDWPRNLSIHLERLCPGDRLSQIHSALAFFRNSTPHWPHTAMGPELGVNRDPNWFSESAIVSLSTGTATVLLSSVRSNSSLRFSFSQNDGLGHYFTSAGPAPLVGRPGSSV
jgi:hypothetical protein